VARLRGLADTGKPGLTGTRSSSKNTSPIRRTIDSELRSAGAAADFLWLGEGGLSKTGVGLGLGRQRKPGASERVPRANFGKSKTIHWLWFGALLGAARFLRQEPRLANFRVRQTNFAAGLKRPAQFPEPFGNCGYSPVFHVDLVPMPRGPSSAGAAGSSPGKNKVGAVFQGVRSVARVARRQGMASSKNTISFCVSRNWRKESRTSRERWAMNLSS